MSDYRPPLSSGELRWVLPEGYSIGSITMRLPVSLPPYVVYVTYERMEEIHGQSCRIATGMTGQGTTFEEALSIAMTKAEASLHKQRADRLEWIKNPKAPPKIMGTAPKIDLSDINIEGLDLGDL